MILKKILFNKYNIYLFLLFILISIFGTIYMYKNKDLHDHMYTYKVRIPYITKIKNEVNSIGTTNIPFMDFYNFVDYIQADQGVLESCPDFAKSVRLSIWEARNAVDYRIQIKSKNTKNIIKCIDKIIIKIEEKKKEMVLQVKKINQFENSVFEESVKKIIENKDFAKFREFVNQEVRDIEIPNYGPSAILEILAAALEVEIKDQEEKELPGPNYSDNFLRGYVYNFLESYKSYRYIDSLSETKYQKISERYFLKDNIYKFNLGLSFIFVLSIISVNINNLRKLF